jgi:hypothetical protein
MNKKNFQTYIIFLVLIIAVITSCSSTATKFKKIITQKDFVDLNTIIASCDSLKNLAILPDTAFIVINGTVINNQKRTFGQEPELGFYIEYYLQGSKNKYINLDQLLDSIQVKLDSAQILTLIDKMKGLGIQDIVRDNNDTLLINYRWDVSAMYGEGGVIFTSRNVDYLSGRLKVFKKLDNEFYYFED